MRYVMLFSTYKPLIYKVFYDANCYDFTMRTHKHPILLFAQWYAQAKKLNLENPNATTLCTATKTGKPSARMVLLKQVHEEGFVFFTNFESRKGNELQENPRAALVFYWDKLQKQIRIEGSVKKISARESEKYFRTRNLTSQLGAWASKQSKKLASREKLLKELSYYENKFKNKKIPLPPHWGGYCIQAKKIEFWIQKKDRLHDRLCYTKKSGKWICSRLYP